MTKIKNKILIVLDGSEELENSLDIVTETNILNCDQIVLFFILNPFNPITKGQEREVLYNDFVHDHGRRLATLYIEKLESLIHSKNIDIEISNNLVNSYENIARRLSLGDIDLTIFSIKFSNKIDYVFNKSKNLNYLLNVSNKILILPYEFIHNSSYKNNLIVSYSELNNKNTFDIFLKSFNFDRITLLYEKQKKSEAEEFIDQNSNKNLSLELLENNSKLFEHLIELSREYNLIFSKELNKKMKLWDSFKKFSNYSFLNKKIPLFFHK